MNRFILAIFSSVAFLLYGCASYGPVLKKTEYIPAGKIQITSMPSGAKVELNQTYIGRTPLDLRLKHVRKIFWRYDQAEFVAYCLIFPLAFPLTVLFARDHEGQWVEYHFGNYYKTETSGYDNEITVFKDGFSMVIETVNSKDAPLTLHFGLSGGPGEHKIIHIISTPPEASVYLEDGTLLGKTPLDAKIPFKYKRGNLEANIVIKKDGFRPTEKKLSMDEDEIDINLSMIE